MAITEFIVPTNQPNFDEVDQILPYGLTLEERLALPRDVRVAVAIGHTAVQRPAGFANMGEWKQVFAEETGLEATEIAEANRFLRQHEYIEVQRFRTEDKHERMRSLLTKDGRNWLDGKMVELNLIEHHEISETDIANVTANQPE
jgi:hypothetical protein